MGKSRAQKRSANALASRHTPDHEKQQLKAARLSLVELSPGGNQLAIG
jgi:hypothetical protein